MTDEAPKPATLNTRETPPTPMAQKDSPATVGKAPTPAAPYDPLKDAPKGEGPPKGAESMPLKEQQPKESRQNPNTELPEQNEVGAFKKDRPLGEDPKKMVAEGGDADTAKDPREHPGTGAVDIIGESKKNAPAEERLNVPVAPRRDHEPLSERPAGPSAVLNENMPKPGTDTKEVHVHTALGDKLQKEAVSKRLAAQITWVRSPTKVTPDAHAKDVGEADFGGFVLINKEGKPNCVFTPKGSNYTAPLDLKDAKSLTEAHPLVGQALVEWLIEHRPLDPLLKEFISSATQPHSKLAHPTKTETMR